VPGWPLAGHECAEIVDLNLGEILVVVKRFEALGFEVHELEVEALGADEPVPMGLGNAWRDEALIGSVYSEGDQAIHEGDFASHPWADGLSGHVTAVNDGVAGEDAERRGVARHLEVRIFEDVFVAVEALPPGQAGRAVPVLDPSDLPGEIVTGCLVYTCAFAQDGSTVPFIAATRRGLSVSVTTYQTAGLGTAAHTMFAMSAQMLPDWCVNMMTCIPLSGIHSVIRL
jgi:hypothetical protein